MTAETETETKIAPEVFTSLAAMLQHVAIKAEAKFQMTIASVDGGWMVSSPTRAGDNMQGVHP